MTDTPLPDPVTPPRYAGFNIRMFASMIDMGIIALVSDDLINILSTHLFPPTDVQPMIEKLQQSSGAGAEGMIAQLLDIFMQQQVFQVIAFKNFCELISIAIYTLPFWMYFSSTPGKMLFGLSIRDARTQARLTPKQSIQRFFGYIMAFLPLTLGFAWISMNKKRQGLHDLLADTIVIKLPRKEVISLTPTHQSADR